MSIKAVAWALKQDLPAIPKMVLITLADHHNGETNQCNPSVRRICSMAGVTQRTVEHHIVQLKSLGYLTVTEVRRPDRSRTSNQYNLLLDGVPNAPGGELAAPGDEVGSPLEPGIEPGIESTEDSFTSVQESSTANQTKKQAKRVTEIDDAFREQMRQRFGLLFGDTVQERIDEAVGHKTHKTYDDKQSHVRGWLRRDAERMGATNNGKGRARRVEPSNDLSRYEKF